MQHSPVRLAHSSIAEKHPERWESIAVGLDVDCAEVDCAEVDCAEVDRDQSIRDSTNILHSISDLPESCR